MLNADQRPGSRDMHATDDRLTFDGVVAELCTPHGRMRTRSRGHHVKEVDSKTVPII